MDSGRLIFRQAGLDLQRPRFFLHHSCSFGLVKPLPLKVSRGTMTKRPVRSFNRVVSKELGKTHGVKALET